MIRLILIFIIATTASLAGCATGPQHQTIQQRIKVPETLPDKLVDQGLLVATIAGNAIATNMFEQLSFSFAGIQIDDIYYSNAVRDNHLVLPLKPGEYTLDSIYVYRNSGDRTPILYPLFYKFRIVSGQATSLGVISLLRNSKAAQPEGRFLRILIKNNEEMTAYLRKQYPSLAASLSPPTPVLASHLRFAGEEVIESVRQEIARDATLWHEEPNIAQYAAGEIGTIAKLLRNTRGKIAALDILDTKTTAAMRSCSGHGNRYVCSSSEPALYFVRDNKVEKRALPVPAKHVWVHTYPPRGLVLVDQNMTIYLSNDEGASWKKHVWFPLKTPLTPYARIKFTNGKNGYYVYSAFTADPLASEVLYSEYAREGFRKVEIPKLRHWQRLVETSEGLLVGPLNPDADDEKAKVYFRPTGQTEWTVRPLPGKRCFYLKHEAENSDKLLVHCDDKLFSTSNTGGTWAEAGGEKK